MPICGPRPVVDDLPGVTVALSDLQTEYTWLTGRNLRSSLIILLAAVMFVLLIACVNVANLYLARGAERRKEMAIRAALGSGRWRLIRQLLTESLLLSSVGAALGILLAKFVITYFAANRPVELPPDSDLRLDLRVLGFTVFLALLTGILSGTIPALQASKLDLNESLKESARGATRSAGSP